MGGRTENVERIDFPWKPNSRTYISVISLLLTKFRAPFLEPLGLSLPALNVFPIKTLNLFKLWGEGECFITLLLRGKLNLQWFPGKKKNQTKDSSIANENNTSKISQYKIALSTNIIPLKASFKNNHKRSVHLSMLHSLGVRN